MKNDVGLIGLSVMGKNLALNMADHGYKVSVYNRTSSVTQEVMKENPHSNLFPCYSLSELTDSLKSPRIIVMMVKAGNPVDQVSKDLLPLLEKGDILIDGGNSYFKDTIEREAFFKERGIHYMGVGISGGEEGARFGPAMMPGGSKEAYEKTKDLFNSIAAKVDGEPCSHLVASDGGGHFLKMVHNGIEYGDMQLIAESYQMMKNILHYDNEKLHQVYEKWNKGELESYLIEITRDIFAQKEEEHYVIDVIEDVVSQKGTGLWTSKEGLDLGVNLSVMSTALNARYMSGEKKTRELASKILGNKLKPLEDVEDLEEDLKKALYLSKVISYAQGFTLLAKAAKIYGWEFNFVNIAKGFRGGCIIRARLLETIAKAFEKQGDLDLLLTEEMKEMVIAYEKSLRRIVSVGALSGVSLPAFSSALTYLLALKENRSPANLLAAQRDFFGAHKFQRVGREEMEHFLWRKLDG